MTSYRWLTVVVFAGCETTADPYDVLAAADLSGTAGIEGPLEVLGSGTPIPVRDGRHMLAAYHIDLPDQASRRVRLFHPGSCDTPHDEVTLEADLGTIRRVGSQTHFFAPAAIAGRIIEVDTMTTTAFVSLNPEDLGFYAPSMIAVVQDLDDDEPGSDSGSVPKGSGSRPWLACGAFEIAPSAMSGRDLPIP